MAKKKTCQCGCSEFLTQIDNCEGGTCVEKCESCGCAREDETDT